MSQAWHKNQKVLSFDDTGELILEVGTSPSTPCRVCPKSLARVSPVFKAMLYGGFAESKSQHGDWVVQLPEDKIAGFAIMLDIIHGHVHKVPAAYKDFCEYVKSRQERTDVTIDMVYHAARAADKYAIVHLLRPWAESWIKLMRRIWDIGGGGWRIGWRGELIWVAWIFGDMQLMNEHLESLFLKAKIPTEDDTNPELAQDDPGSRDGSPEDGGVTEELDGVEEYRPMVSRAKMETILFSLTPMGDRNEILCFLDMPDKIKQRRYNLIKAMLDPVVAFLTDPNIAEDGKCDAHRKTPGSPNACDPVDWIIVVLNCAELYPVPAPESCRHSVGELYKLLKTANANFSQGWRFEAKLARRDTEPIFCTGCNPFAATMKEIQAAYASGPFVTLTPSQTARMEKQRKMCGLPSVQEKKEKKARDRARGQARGGRRRFPPET